MDRWVPVVPAVAGVATVVLVVVLLLGSEDAPVDGTRTAGTAAAGTAGRAAEAEGVLLRLTDLTAGYAIGDDSGCGAITPEGADEPLNQYIEGEFPAFCRRQLEYVCRTRPEGRAAVVESALVFLASEEKASEGLAVAPSLARYLASIETKREQDGTLALGDEAVVFHAQLFHESDGVLIAWRNGTRIGLVAVGGLAEAEALGLAGDLARLQNGRFTDPQPEQPSDTDDAAVRLDCRDSEAPVYWLGETFSPAGGLPDVELMESQGPDQPGGGPGQAYRLEYGAPGEAGFEISVWEPEAWETFMQTELGPFSTSRPCAEPEAQELPDRRIEVHAPADGCAERYMLHVFFEEAVVTVNVPFALCCTGPSALGSGRFVSPQALEAIGRGLVRRE